MQVMMVGKGLPPLRPFAHREPHSQAGSTRVVARACARASRQYRTLDKVGKRGEEPGCGTPMQGNLVTNCFVSHAFASIKREFFILYSVPVLALRKSLSGLPASDSYDCERSRS